MNTARPRISIWWIFLSVGIGLLLVFIWNMNRGPSQRDLADLDKEVSLHNEALANLEASAQLYVESSAQEIQSKMYSTDPASLDSEFDKIKHQILQDCQAFAKQASALEQSINQRNYFLKRYRIGYSIGKQSTLQRLGIASDFRYYQPL